MSQDKWNTVLTRSERRKAKERRQQALRRARQGSGRTGVSALLADWLVDALKKVHGQWSSVWDDVTPSGRLAEPSALPAEHFESPYKLKDTAAVKKARRRRRRGKKGAALPQQGADEKKEQTQGDRRRSRRGMSTRDVHRLLAWLVDGNVVTHMGAEDIYGVNEIMRAYGTESMCPQGVCLAFAGLLRWVRAEALRDGTIVRGWLSKLGFTSKNKPLLETKSYRGLRRNKSKLVVSKATAHSSSSAPEPPASILLPSATDYSSAPQPLKLKGAWAQGRPAAVPASVEDPVANSGFTDRQPVYAPVGSVEHMPSLAALPTVYEHDERSDNEDDEEAWTAIDAHKVKSPVAAQASSQPGAAELEVQHSPDGAWTIRMKGVPAQMGAALQAVLAQAMHTAPAQ